MVGFDVVPETVRAEAKRWQEHSDAVEPVRDAVAGAKLAQTAFWCGDPMVMVVDYVVHANAYEQFRDFVEDLLKGAVPELDEVAGALVKTAELYEHRDTITYEKLAEIYGEMKGR
jgi:hypothetical protein